MKGKIARLFLLGGEAVGFVTVSVVFVMALYDTVSVVMLSVVYKDITEQVGTYIGGPDQPLKLLGEYAGRIKKDQRKEMISELRSLEARCRDWHDGYRNGFILLNASFFLSHQAGVLGVVYEELWDGWRMKSDH